MKRTIGMWHQRETEDFEAYCKRIIAMRTIYDGEPPKLIAQVETHIKLLQEESLPQDNKPRRVRNFAQPGAGTAGEDWQARQRYYVKIRKLKRSKRTEIITKISQPGKYGGRSAKWRMRYKREKDKRMANIAMGVDSEAMICGACKREIKFEKSQLLCCNPQQTVKRVYSAIICRSCGVGANPRMENRIGMTYDIWFRINSFIDSGIKSWIRYNLATLADERMPAFLSYIAKLNPHVRYPVASIGDRMNELTEFVQNANGEGTRLVSEE